MNLLLLKQLSILSAFLGGFMGLIALFSPFLLWVFLLSFVVPAIIIIVYMKRNDLIGLISPREGAICGAIIGAVSFIAEFIVFAPISVIISWLFKLIFKSTYAGGVLSLLPFDFGTIFILFLCVFLLAGLSAVFNGFTGLSTAYIYELVTGIKKENNQNNTIDFEINR